MKENRKTKLGGVPYEKIKNKTKGLSLFVKVIVSNYEK